VPDGGSPSLSPGSPEPAASDAQTAPPVVPPEVLAAIQQGDVANLMGLLRAEHAKRSGVSAAAGNAPQAPASPSAAGLPASSPASATAPPGEVRAGIDAAIIDELIRIGADNGVTVDWLMLRAVRLYVEEYRKTGRL